MMINGRLIITMNVSSVIMIYRALSLYISGFEIIPPRLTIGTKDVILPKVLLPLKGGIIIFITHSTTFLLRPTAVLIVTMPD